MNPDRPLIAAAIIVKNESEHLRRCLSSIREFCDEIVVVDTGSTDDTVAIAESFGARVLHKPWRDDFAASRNFALDAVTAEWVLYIDADEELVMGSVDAMRAVVGEATNVMAFGLRMHTQVNWTPYFDYRLWRHGGDIRFTGEIHESTMPDILRVARDTSRILQTTDVDILHHGYEGDLTAKHRRNLPLLLAELKVHPEKINLWNHLGRVHLALGRPDLAERAWRTGIERIERVGPLTRFDVQIYASLADFLIASGQDAQAILDRGRALDPTFKTFTWLQVRQHMQRGEFVDAIRCTDELIEIGRSGAVEEGVAYNLDMFATWPRAARIDCLFELMRFADVREAIEILDEPSLPDSRRRKQLDVCDAMDAWHSAGIESSVPTTPIRLDDVAFIVPVRIESADRLANVLALTRHLTATYECRILLGCEQPDSLRSLVPQGVEVVAVEGSPDHAFHATRVINEVGRHTDAPIRIHCDTDTLIPVSQILRAVDLLRHGDADMVLPFSFGIGVSQAEREEFANGEIRLARVDRPRPMVGVPVGLCQMWSAESFVRAGMENEYMIGWSPDDVERVERAEMLGMRVQRVSGPAFHLDHTIADDRVDQSPFHALSQDERERTGKMSSNDLRLEAQTWPWLTRGPHRAPSPLVAPDLTVVIPVRIDSPDRLRNLVTCTRALLSTLDCRIVVGIGAPALVVEHLDSRVEVVTVVDTPAEAFHRTHIINDLVLLADTKWVAVMDTDVVVPRSQWLAALEQLRHEHAELVYPFDGRMVEVPFAVHSWLERGELDALAPSACQLIEANSVGGCYLVDRATYMVNGMENEHFLSWGYEDDERLLRAHKLGAKVSRVDGSILHIAHQRGTDSGPGNPHLGANVAELQRVKALTNTQLRAEVDTWPWKVCRADVRVLLWNDVWHDDRYLVDARDRGVEIVRDRDRLGDCDVVIVGLPAADAGDLPEPGKAIRVLFSREAAAHVPALDDRQLTAQFELIASHRRNSDLWCPYVHPALIGTLPAIVPLSERQETLASAWISSDWDASNRMSLLNELMLFMQIDSYGRRSKNVGEVVIQAHAERWRIAAQYRFVMAFENARENDYVTEKFFEPLVFGAVPVYLGAPNVDEFAPGDHCYVDASRFSSPRELAEFLSSMSDQEYLRYHEWRESPRRESFVDLYQRVPRTVLSPLIRSIREQRSPNPS